MISHECEIKVISEAGGKVVVPALIKKSSQTEDAMTGKKIDTTVVDKMIFYKVPAGPLVTLTFTTNPNMLVRKKKDKKKAKPARGKKSKKAVFEDLPVPKDNNPLLPKKAYLDLANSVIDARLSSMKKKYELNDFMFSTEPILKWDANGGEDPNRYLDFIREIDDELVKYQPFHVAIVNRGKLREGLQRQETKTQRQV